MYRFYYTIVLYCIVYTMYRIVAIQPFGCNTSINIFARYCVDLDNPLSLYIFRRERKSAWSPTATKL